MTQENTGLGLAPNGLARRSAAVAERQDADLGRGGPAARSACSSRRADAELAGGLLGFDRGWEWDVEPQAASTRARTAAEASAELLRARIGHEPTCVRTRESGTIRR
jgi:hypothetical protein